MPDYSLRLDGTPKGSGYFGPLPYTGPNAEPDSKSTEISVGVNVGGKQLLIPLLVPTLDKAEVNHLLSGQKHTRAILDKAVDFALERIKSNKSPFAGPSDYPNIVPQPNNTGALTGVLGE